MLLSSPPPASQRLLKKKDSWKKKMLEGKLTATTGPSDLEADIKSTGSAPALANDDSNDSTFRTLIASGRPFIIVKVARSGSSWLGKEITAAAHKIGFNVTIKNEVTNHFIPLQGPVKPLPGTHFEGTSELEVCQESIEFALEKLAEGGFTLNPSKGGYTSTMLKGNTTCWEMLVERIQEENIQPNIVILWRRKNVVARAVSAMYSHYVERNDLCYDPYHLERCPDFPRPPIHYSPENLVRTISRKAKQNRDLIKFAMDFKVPYYAFTYEETLDYSGSGHPRLLDGVMLDKQLRHCEGSQCEESQVEAPPGSFEKAYVQQRMTNWPEVYQYIKKNKPELLPMLLEE